MNKGKFMRQKWGLSPKRSLIDAFRGLVYIFRYELSFRIQVIAAVIVFAAIFCFPLKNYERLVIILIVGLVLILEIINSLIERIIDLLNPALGERARIIKDMMAGAVLISSIIALVVGFLIFVPYIVK